jgi:thiosulfate dehydrogenase [quinone] large subunit
MGWTFFWAFLDKLFGLGFTTTPDAAWLNGGSPTTGFLKFGTYGPFSTFFQSLAGQVWVDWLFMLGLMLIGLTLILGIALRLAAFGGTILMILMWLALLPPEHNPVTDEHIIYALVLVLLTLSKSGDHWGLGKKWSKLDFVAKNKWLQ